MRARRFVVPIIVLLAAVLAPAASAAGGLTTGFSADPILTGPSASTSAPWIGRAVTEGAGIVRINLVWSEVAPVTRPRGFAAGDPRSPGYNWTGVDASVRNLAAHGLQVLMNITFAPAWAEGPHRPGSAADGTWRPDATQFGQFARAAALRYDGGFPDPINPGAALPRVRDWQAWNEPNLSIYLSPQWSRTRNGYAPASPAIYRQLLNAFYAAVKGLSRSNFVVMAGTAPYGDQPGGQRMQPVAFDRTLFCLSGAGLRPTSCPDPAHLDAVSHHPYAIYGPLAHALNPDDASVPDIYKIARVLRAAERSGRVLPRGHKRLWVTEISWDSSPPDPHGVPIAEHARWLEQALYVLWRQGVDTVLWLQIVDSPPVPNYASTYQAGLFYLDGAPKPAATAFRFPFVTNRVDRGHILAWGRSPVAGRLMIEQLHAGRWRVIARLSVAVKRVFLKTVAVRGQAVLRAQIAGQTSLTWSQPS
jgi:hypothetical protein